MYYPNQKRITVRRENVSNSKANSRPYLIAYQDNMLEAMKCLTPAAYKVYMCLLFNTDGFVFDFSPERFKDMTGLCKDTIRKALTLLQLRGYLVPDGESKYIFRETPMIEVSTNI